MGGRRREGNWEAAMKRGEREKIRKVIGEGVKKMGGGDGG